MSVHDDTYHALLVKALEEGSLREDRTGTGTYSVFGTQSRYDLNDGFPLLTTKKIPFKAVAVELLWFLRGDTNIKFLHEHGVTIWDEWADENGDLGPVYGKQWTDWDGMGIDQIAEVVGDIKNNPTSRRLIVSAWNVFDIPDMALPPCHIMFQFYVDDDKLSCHLYQRSGDLFLGVPFNVASYSLLTHMISQVCGLGVGEFVHTIGDAHLYVNHQAQALEQLSRDTKGNAPTLWLNPDIGDVFEFGIDDIVLEGYHPQPAIKAPVAV